MGGSVQLAFALGLLFAYKGLAARSATFDPDDFEDDGDDEFGGSGAEDGFDDEDELGSMGSADSYGGDDNDGFGASPSSASSSSSSGSGSFQEMDLVLFAKDGIMSLNPKQKRGEPERLSRYKAGQLGQIRKVLGKGRYIVCVGKVQRTAAGVLGLSRSNKQGTKCPGGEVQLGQADLKAKKQEMEVWDDSTQDMKKKVVDVMGVGQRVKILRPGQLKTGQAWARNTEGVVAQVLKGNKYKVCVAGKLRNNFGVVSCTGAGFFNFPAYQLQKLGK